MMRICAFLLTILMLISAADSALAKTQYASASVARGAPQPPVKPMWRVDQEHAVMLARGGTYPEAISILSELYRAHGDDMNLARDYLTVLGWAGNNDAEVARLYESMPDQDQPDYVLEAVGRAYRTLKKPAEAAVVYQRGLTRTPSKEAFAVGLIRSLSESDYNDRALSIADSNIQNYGKRAEVLVAAGDTALAAKQPKTAIGYFKTALDVSPTHRDAVHGYIIAADRGGWHRVAWESANNNPSALSPAEYREIVGNDSASLVRKGMEEQPADRSDFSRTDEALHHLNKQIDTWKISGEEATPDLRRAQFDRILALRNRSRANDVLNEYEKLNQEGVRLPAYAMSSVADAYLATHEPEKARDIYIRLVTENPSDLDLRRQLFYAYIEANDYDDALKLADTWPASANGARNNYSAQLLSGAARLYSGQVAAADPIIRQAVAMAPRDPSSFEAMGNLYMAHGWPRAAYGQYQSGGKNLINEIGLANASLALQHYDEAEARAQDLITRYPKNTHAQRVKHDWDIHQMAEFRLLVGYAPQPLSGVGVTGGENYGINATIYSMPFWKNWRIFAGEYYSYQKQPNLEGKISFSHTRAGVEYRNDGLTASIAPTFSHYKRTDRVGGEAEAAYALDDQWSIAGRGEIMSRDVPLRALNSGVTAHQGSAKVTWREDEARQVSVGTSFMPFSDGNDRTSGYVTFVQRLHTAPRYYLDGLADVAMSTNSKDSNRSYYNPKTDAVGLVGARFVHTLHQHYQTLWQHSLRVTPGAYWQKNYGTDATLRARYEHRVFLTDVFEAGAGMNYSRQSYDGNAEDDIGATLDVIARF